MVKETVEIINQSGLHARPASDFIQAAMKFKSKILIGRESEEQRLDAKSIITMLSLGLSQGEKIELVCEGEDEEEALQTLVDLINSGFGE